MWSKYKRLWAILTLWWVLAIAMLRTLTNWLHATQSNSHALKGVQNTLVPVTNLISESQLETTDGVQSYGDIAFTNIGSTGVWYSPTTGHLITPLTWHTYLTHTWALYATLGVALTGILITANRLTHHLYQHKHINAAQCRTIKIWGNWSAGIITTLTLTTLALQAV